MKSTRAVEELFKDVCEILRQEIEEESNQHIKVTLRRVGREIIRTYNENYKDQNGS